MDVYSFSFSIVIFFLNPGTSTLFKKISQTKLFFIGLRTLKPTRTRTLNRIPIWHGLTLNDERLLHMDFVIPNAINVLVWYLNG